MDNKWKKYSKVVFITKAVKYLAIAVYLTFSSQTQAQITLSADTGRIGWGERVRIEAKMGVSADENLVSLDSFPQWTDSIPGGLEVIEILGPDTIAPSEDDPEEWDYVIVKSWVATAWDSGFVDLPGLQIQKVPTRTGDKNELVVHAEIIEVNWTASERFILALPYILYFLLLISILGILYYLYKKYGNKATKSEEPEPEIILPPHIEALKRLKNLKSREAWLKGDEKTFQVDLSQTIRRYIDRRFGVSSLDKTSSEAVTIIKSLDISDTEKHKLSNSLILGDQVKFAKFKAAHDIHLKSLNDCIEFVQNTKIDEVD